MDTKEATQALISGLQDPFQNRLGVTEVDGCFAITSGGAAHLWGCTPSEARTYIRALVSHPQERSKGHSGEILYRLPLPYQSRAETLAAWLMEHPERLPLRDVPSGRVTTGGDVAKATGLSSVLCGKALAIVAETIYGAHRAAFWDPEAQQTIRGWRFPDGTNTDATLD